MKFTLKFSAITLIILSLSLLGVFLIVGQNAFAAYGLDPGIMQVKTANNPTVYYLDHNRGMKKAYNTEAAYLSYGNKWSDIKIVSQEMLDKWQDVYLVKTANNPAVYNIYKNQKSLIFSEGEFKRFGFNWGDIVTISQEDLDSYTLTNLKFGGNPDYPTGLILAGLDSSSPDKYYASVGTIDNLVAVFNFSGEKGVVEIKELKLNLIGVFNSQIIENIYLKDINQDSYKIDGSLDKKTVTFNLASNPVVISEGQVKKIGIYLDLVDSYDSLSGHYFRIIMNDNNYISTDAFVQGTFPLSSNIIYLIDATNLLGEIKAYQESVITAGSEAIIGTTDKILTEYRIKETSNQEDIIIKELTFENYGSSLFDNLNNFKLKNKKNETIAQISEISGTREIKFTLNNYKIDRGSYDVFTLYADILNGEGKNINLKLIKINAQGEDYGYNLTSKFTHLDETLNIIREDIGVIAKDLKTSKNVFKNQSGTIIGLFEVRSDIQKITLENIEVSLDKSALASNLDETIFLINYDNGEVISSLKAGALNSGQATLDLKKQELKSKDELTLALVTEIPSEAQSGNIYAISLNKITYKLPSGQYYTDEVNVIGKTLTISRSNLYIYNNSDLGEQTRAKGEKKVKIASFMLESSTGEDINISSLTLSKGDTSGSITYDNGFSNIKLYIGASKKGATIERPYSNIFTFEGFTYKFKEGKRVEVKIYADTEEDLKVSETELMITEVIALGNKSGVKTAIHGLNTRSHITTFADNIVSLEAISGGVVEAGEDSNLVATFKIENTGQEILDLKYITVNTTKAGFSYSLGYSNLQIREEASAKKIGRATKPVASSNFISLGGYDLEVNEELYFDVYIDASKDVLEDNFEVYFSNLEARGKKSKIEAKFNDNTNKVSVSVTGSLELENPLESGLELIWPVSGDINYSFYDPNYPFAPEIEHQGIDIGAAQGTPVKAAASGLVISVVDGGDEGTSYLIIEHNDIYKTVYGHLSEIQVEVGDEVSSGDIIGLSGGIPGTPGAGGFSTGPHLHFEVQFNSTPVDPMDYLK
ncbi:MAG: M23 family metallopeptidase [Patescibacteria group bacterium]